MKTYKQIPNEKAYKLLNTGALIIVSSVDSNQQYNLAPIAWQCPVEFDPVTQVLFVCDKEHKTFKNVVETGKFAICLPHSSQHTLVTDLGSCSGSEVNKVEKFNVKTFISHEYKLSIPDNVIGYLECKLLRVIEEASVGIVIGEVVYADVDSMAYNDRLLSETEAGKTIHHLGGKKFIQPGNLLT